MKQYLELLNHIIENGKLKEDRTGTGTLSVFGYQMRFSLKDNFPIVTTKKVHLDSVIHELLWFLKGDTNVRYLQENNVRIWNEWASLDGNLGPIYGKQWRNFGGVDQIAQVIDQIKNTPDSRRLIVSSWNPPEIPQMALPPCHCFYQFYVQDNELSCQLYQRSADVFLGVPFNISSYALLTTLIAHHVGLKPGEFVHTMGDAHLYLDHLDQAKLQLTREPKELPTLEILNKHSNIEDYKIEDFNIKKYNHHPHIKAKVSV